MKTDKCNGICTTVTFQENVRFMTDTVIAC